MSDEAVKFLINSLLLIVLLLTLYYLSLKFNLRLKTPGKGEIEVLDRYPLDRESSLILFKVRGKIFLCYHSKGNFKILDEWKYEKNTASEPSDSTG